MDVDENVETSERRMDEWDESNEEGENDDMNRTEGDESEVEIDEADKSDEASQLICRNLVCISLY